MTNSQGNLQAVLQFDIFFVDTAVCDYGNLKSSFCFAKCVAFRLLSTNLAFKALSTKNMNLLWLYVNEKCC